MATQYRVKPGDCISSIAFAHGFFPDTLWNHPENEALKAKRKDPSVLEPDDVVFVPDKRQKTVTGETDSTHVFRYRGVPARLNLVVRCYGVPLADKPFELEVDGKRLSGRTAADGAISVPIPPDAKTGKLLVEDADVKLEYLLDLGHLAPVDGVIGFKQRLQNLGYEVLELDGEETEVFRSAICNFEVEHGLPVTGTCGDENRAKLREVYGR